jgi:hypothetical protein
MAAGISAWFKLSAPASAPSTLRVVPQQNVAQAGFQFIVDGQAAQSYVSEYSTNLASLIPFSTNQMVGTEISITDLGATNSKARFYRARVGPWMGDGSSK